MSCLLVNYNFMDLLIFAGLIVGITQVVKMTFALESRYIPLSAIVISLVFMGCYVVLGGVFTWGLLQNTLLVALSSVGLYSGAKNTLQS